MANDQDGYAKFFKQARKAASAGKNAARPNDPSRGRSSYASADPNKKSRFKIPLSRFEIGAEGPERPLETSEDRLKRELVRRARARRERIQKRRPPFPTSSLLGVALAASIGGFALLRPDVVETAWGSTLTTLNRYDIGFLGQASAAPDSSKAVAATSAKSSQADGAPGAGAAANSTSPPIDSSAAAATSSSPGNAKSGATSAAKTAANGKPDAANSSATQASGASAEGGVPHALTADEISVYSKLGERKRQLDQREAELGKLEEELQKQKAELEKKLQRLENVRREIASTLKARVDNDQEKVDKLVQVYSNMKPQQAAKVIETLNEDLAVEVLDKLKKQNAAEILNVMDAKKAQKLSEILAGYKRAE